MASVSVLTVSKRKGWQDLATRCMMNQTVGADDWVIIQQGVNAPNKKRGYQSALNASLNAGLKKIKSDYVIFYQDFIELEPNTIEKLVAAAEETGGFVTTATINPDGQHDNRYTGVDIVRRIYPEEWEANVAIAPMKAMRELGGFSEEYDKGWSWDNCNVAVRADMLGYNFYIDESIKPKLHFHPKEPVHKRSYD